MPNQKKKDTVSSLTSEVKSADVIVITDYSGLTHQQLETVRGKVKDASGNLHIVKNSLLKLALKEVGKDQDENRDLTGPSAVLLTTQANLTPLKVLYDSIKEHENFKIKGGIFNNEVVDTTYVIRIANLPSREQLISQLLGQLKTPHTRLVLTLQNPLTKLAIALSKIREQKETAVS